MQSVYHSRHEMVMAWNSLKSPQSPFQTTNIGFAGFHSQNTEEPLLLDHSTNLVKVVFQRKVVLLKGFIYMETRWGSFLKKSSLKREAGSQPGGL